MLAWFSGASLFSASAMAALEVDDDAIVTLKWFRGGESSSKWGQKDAWLLVTGEVKRYRFAKEIAHPEVERLFVDADHYQRMAGAVNPYGDGKAAARIDAASAAT